MTGWADNQATRLFISLVSLKQSRAGDAFFSLGTQGKLSSHPILVEYETVEICHFSQGHMPGLLTFVDLRRVSHALHSKDLLMMGLPKQVISRTRTAGTLWSTCLGGAIA
jgi:hypothetical protein